MIDRMLRDRLLDAYMMLIPLISVNVAWFVASLPLITAIPAAGGLFYATNQMAHGKSASISTFIEGFRWSLRRSWAWGLLNLLFAAAAVGYWLMFARADTELATWGIALIVVVAILWLTLQVYTFPLLLEQEKPSLRLALRNAVILVLRRPFFSFGAALLLLAIGIGAAVVIAPAWIFIIGAGCAYIANLATLSSIARTNGRRPASPVSAEPPAV